MRDDRGAWITGYYGSCGYTTSLHVELFGIYNGLQIAWQQGFKKIIICKSDSQLAIELILWDVNSFHLYHPLILNIQNFRNLQWDLSFNNLYKEGNKMADWLAKEGSSSQQHFDYHAPMSNFSFLWLFCWFYGTLLCEVFLLSLIIFADFTGHSYVRS